MGEETVHDILFAENVMLVVKNGDPITQSEYFKKYFENVKEYSEAQPDNSFSFPLLHSDVAYFGHLIHCDGGGRVVMEYGGIVEAEQENQKFNIQVIYLSLKVD